MIKPVKIVLLTTETSHHTYFAWKLSQEFQLKAIFVEGRRLTPPFETFHSFEELRDRYEREVLLAEGPKTLAEVAKTVSVHSVNDEGSVSALTALASDVVLVFGTGKLLPPIIRAASVACLNLHGGNPESYRGLDTHLWAIYHEDFDNLVTTLHHVDGDLDTGNIVFQSALPMCKDSKLHELRARNTEVCLELCRLTLNSLATTGRLPGRRQERRGRYYSFMPTPLKEECLKKFERHIARL